MTPKTHIDWLAFRTHGEVPAAAQAVQRAYGSLAGSFSLKHRSRGWQGYQQSADLLVAEMRVGLMAWGGENQRDWVHVSLTGQGCEWISDWDLAQEEFDPLVPDWRRVDIALDTVGKDVSHQTVIGAYRAGMFTTSGRPPKCQRIESERPEDGRTVYIGSRENDKFFRGYEKGLQLAALSKLSGLTHIDGAPIEDMYRCELEVKAKSGTLPSDLIDNRDQYFAGSYPYLQHVLHEVEPEVLKLDRRLAARCELNRRLETIREMFGTSLYTALVVNHGDIGAVWERIVGSKHNDDLVRAGALLLECE